MSYQISQINTSYGKKQILENISFEFEENQITAIIGDNGCGKSTLVKSLCNLLPHSGSFYKDELNLSSLSIYELAKIVGYIPQRSGISIDVSVLDVVLMGFNTSLKIFESPDKDMRLKAIKALQDVGIQNHEQSYMELSEGLKQLTLFARVLVADPDILILDEPESSLDLNWRYQMFKLLRKQNKTVLIVLHDLHLALNYADKIVLMHQGKVAGELYPKTDEPKHIEQVLNRIYNNIKVGETTENTQRVLYLYK